MLFGFEWDTSSSWDFAVSILPILLVGLWVTVQATLLGFAIAVILGLVLAALKAAPLRIIAWPARVITEFIRDTPLLIQLFFLYYVLPEYGLVLPAFMTGALALGLQYSAYLKQCVGFLAYLPQDVAGQRVNGTFILQHLSIEAAPLLALGRRRDERDPRLEVSKDRSLFSRSR